jgi:glycosyltransferase involved in cell wall biosynthesis
VVLVAPRIRGRLSPVLPAVVSTLRLRRSVDRLISVDAASFWQGAPDYDCSPFVPALARAVRRFDPVAVVAVYCWMAPCLDAVTNGALKAVDTLDLMHVRVGMYGGVETGAWVDCTAEQEAEKLAHADVVIAIQRHEQREFQAMLPGKRVVCVPHMSWPSAARRAPADADVVTFVGSKNDGNTLGIRTFIREGWPMVRGARPGAELRVYGDVGGRLESRDREAEGVRIMGFVKNLDEAYEDATVVINPVQLGTGLKIKTLEALAAGKAVVTTTCGAAGLEEGAHAAYLLEDDMRRFGDAVQRLLADAHERAALEGRAQEFARAHFGPRAALAELLEAIESRVPRPVPRAPLAPVAP